MSEKFRVVITCIILTIFAFPSIAILKGSGKPSQWLYIEQWCSVFRFHSGFILLSLMNILGFFKKKIWAKWIGLIICIIVVVLATYSMLYPLFYKSPEYPGYIKTSDIPTFAKCHPIIEYLYLSSPIIGIFILGLTGTILIFSISKKYFYT